MVVEPTPDFSADVAYYIRKKKYLKINDDIRSVTSELEGIFARGDRRLAKVIEKAYKRGFAQ